MPKEVIRSVMDAPVVLPEGVAIEDQPANEPFRVEVGWSRERGDVSIATIDPSKPEIGEPYQGFYVWLDRKGINDLIRNLRRARDQAFGRDE